MRFYNRDGELDGRQHLRTYAEEVAMALSAIDSVLNGENAVYGSSELTTGKRLYRLLRQHGMRTKAELKEKIGEAEFRRVLWDPNVAEANAFARRLRSRLGAAIVVSPAPFIAPGWTQPEYLAFWETLIRSRFRALYFNRDWQYSNGCTFELAVAVDAGLPTHDAEGGGLTLDRAIELVAAAVHEVESAGIEAAGLRENLARLAAEKSARELSRGTRPGQPVLS